MSGKGDFDQRPIRQKGISRTHWFTGSIRISDGSTSRLFRLVRFLCVSAQNWEHLGNICNNIPTEGALEMANWKTIKNSPQGLLPLRMRSVALHIREKQDSGSWFLCKENEMKGRGQELLMISFSTRLMAVPCWRSEPRTAGLYYVTVGASISEILRGVCPSHVERNDFVMAAGWYVRKSSLLVQLNV